MAQYAQLRIDTDLDIYFADPRSPWQRGSNENTVSLGVDRLDWSGRVGVGSPG